MSVASYEVSRKFAWQARRPASKDLGSILTLNIDGRVHKPTAVTIREDVLQVSYEDARFEFSLERLGKIRVAPEVIEDSLMHKMYTELVNSIQNNWFYVNNALMQKVSAELIRGEGAIYTFKTESAGLSLICAAEHDRVSDDLRITGVTLIEKCSGMAFDFLKIAKDGMIACAGLGHETAETAHNTFVKFDKKQAKKAIFFGYEGFTAILQLFSDHPEASPQDVELLQNCRMEVNALFAQVMKTAQFVAGPAIAKGTYRS